MISKDEQKNKRLYQTYGITLEEWTEMFENQQKVCWICKTLPPTGRLSVDHIHIKGFKKMEPNDKKQYVRGLLCFLCNVLVGKFERTNNVQINRKRLFGVVDYFKVYRMKGE